MSREYFNLWFRLDACDSYLIWFEGEDESDGVIIDANGKVPCFHNNEDLLRYAASLKLSVNTETMLLHDLDFVVAWLEAKVEVVDCRILLEAWNLFDDVSHTVNGNFDVNHKLTTKIYEKLFWGNNIPAVTPVGKSYEPTWTKRELKIMREVLSVGLSLFREKMSFG
jgi:hypothetical protein